ncbi:hypothetical protein [Streptomyces sp. NBC_01244]|uniref:hypothetical protein n=1 Tax=Streptomyces sp. NBC_01244 TaxID=2903797 RepID=UPI002E109E60|nr:hypothetical protein OG247_42175 [Streptomyces sp. NBC_01244]
MALALTACEGGASSSGSTKQGTDGELLAQSIQLFRDTPSVRVTAKAAVAMGSGVEISVDRDKNCRVDAQGGFFHVAVERGGRTWMSWSDDYLQRAATSPDGERLDKELRGKWLELGQDGRIRKSMVDLCALTALRSATDQLAEPRQSATREPETTEDGERLVPLRRGEDGNSVTAYVDAGEKPYPRKLVVDVATFAPTPVEFWLGAYGEAVTVEPPAALQTVRSAAIEALAEKNLAAGLPGS